SLLLILSIFQVVDTVRPVWRTPVTNVRKNITARTQRASNSVLPIAFFEYPARQPYYTRPEDYKIPDYRPVKPVKPILPSNFQPNFIPQFVPNHQPFQPQFSQSFRPPQKATGFPTPISNKFLPFYNEQQHPKPPVYPPLSGFSPLGNVRQQVYVPLNAQPYWQGGGPIPPRGAYAPKSFTQKIPMMPAVKPENFHGMIPMQPSVSPEMFEAVHEHGHFTRPVPPQHTQEWVNPSTTISQDFFSSYTSDMPTIFVSQSNPFIMPNTSLPRPMSTKTETSPSLERYLETLNLEDITSSSFISQGTTTSDLATTLATTFKPVITLYNNTLPKLSTVSESAQEHLESVPKEDRSDTTFVDPNSFYIKNEKSFYFPRPALSQVYQPPGHLPQDFTQHIDVNFLKPNRTCVGPICGVDTDKVSLYKPEKGDGSRGPTLLISNAAKGDAARLGYIPPPPKLISEFPVPPTSTEYYSNEFIPGYPRSEIQQPLYPDEVKIVEPYHPEIPKGPHVFVPPQNFPSPPLPSQVPPAQMTLETDTVQSYYPTAKTIATPSSPEFTTSSPSSKPPTSTLQTRTSAPNTLPRFESTSTFTESVPETTTKWPKLSFTYTQPPMLSTQETYPQQPAAYATVPPLRTTTTREQPVVMSFPYPSPTPEAPLSTLTSSSYTIPTVRIETTATTRLRYPEITRYASTSIERSTTTRLSITTTSTAPTSFRSTSTTTEMPTTVSQLPTTSVGSTITMPKTEIMNRIIGKVRVVCKEDGIEFSANTLFPFTGQIFANNRRRVPNCSHNIVNTVAPKVFLPFLECGVKNTGDQRDSRAQYHMQVVMVIQQPDGTSTVQSFMAQCVQQKIHYDKQTLPRRIEEALEELRLVPTKLEQKAPLPQVEMKIVIDEHNQLGPEVTEVDIGMPLAVQWRLLPESDSYGFHVKNCFVKDDIINVEHKMIDELGCSTDLTIFAHPHYDTYHDTASSHLWAFKVPDHTRLRIRCDVSICSEIPSSSTNISSCASIPSPPFCPDLITSPPNSILYDAEGAFLKRRRQVRREFTQSVRAALCTGPACDPQPLQFNKRCFDLHWVAASTGLSFASLVFAIIIHIAVRLKVSQKQR
ncbi:hypothetical protein Angca_000772, partial [Angiostrongylus cantonensis]